MSEVYDTFLGYDNRADEGSLSGGLYYNTMPLNNLRDRNFGVKARTQNTLLSSTQFNFYNGEDRIIKMWAICDHNFSLAAKFRVRASENSDMSAPIYDTGWQDVWPTMFVQNDLEWEQNNFWTGQLADRERIGYKWHLARILPITTIASYWRFEFDDQLHPDGYVEYGRLQIMSGSQFGNNVEYGMGIGWRTDTRIQKALGGNKSYSRRPSYRAAQFTTKFNDENEAFSTWFDMQGRMGIDGEVFYMYDPTDTNHAIRRQWPGTLTQLSPFQHPSVSEWETVWEHEESL